VLDLVLDRVARRERFDTTVLHRLDRRAGLESREPRVYATPAGADEVDEEREVVDARMPLGEQIALEPFEPSDRLVQEAADLCDVAGDGEDLGAKTVADGDADMRRDRSLQLGRGGGERLDLLPRSLERRLEHGRLGSPGGRVGDALLRSLECVSVHERRGYSPRRMDTSELDYDLPPELIAQRPTERRDASRLLVYRRSSRSIEHRAFAELPELAEDCLVVVNDTKVVPARLRLRRKTGGAVEVLLVESIGGGRWEALARPSRRLRAGDRLGSVMLVEALGQGRWVVELEGEPAGDAPLPPYIHEPLADAGRYQTVYADESGSAAAPTAGLHFTPELVERLDPVRVTLHVGLDTFRPVEEEVLEEHAIHGERYAVSPRAWERISSARRVLAVGTTTVRVIETVARTGELAGRTVLFITPGFSFRRVDALLTNFHLPRSTLLALVMAFVGVDEARLIYREAIAQRYRFYSFGDAMVVL
jgi:S-adenosylmethionine:tRNA ribosyltransferase-isomerase